MYPPPGIVPAHAVPSPGSMVRDHAMYRPRHAEASVLHIVIRQHLGDFLRTAADRADGAGLLGGHRARGCRRAITCFPRFSSNFCPLNAAPIRMAHIWPAIEFRVAVQRMILLVRVVYVVSSCASPLSRGILGSRDDVETSAAKRSPEFARTIGNINATLLPAL